MQDRRTFLGLAAASLLPIDLAAQAPAQTAAPPAPRELARHALSGPLEGFEVVLLQLTPRAASGNPNPGHRHPGPVLGYIAEGEMLFGINHQPPEILPPGRTFFEPTGTLHTALASAKADAPSRALVFMIVPKGAPLTSPA
jgi:quercetin dioxygenase-like cupin family protein